MFVTPVLGRRQLGPSGSPPASLACSGGISRQIRGSKPKQVNGKEGNLRPPHVVCTNMHTHTVPHSCSSLPVTSTLSGFCFLQVVWK